VKSSGGGPIVLAGATGDLGGRIAAALGRRLVAFRVLTRPGTPVALLTGLAAVGATVVEVDYDDATALRNACDAASCVVSALNGLEPVMLGMQGKCWMPPSRPASHASSRPTIHWILPRRDPARTAIWICAEGSGKRIDGLPIKATSVLNGAFADLLAGAATIVLAGLVNCGCHFSPNHEPPNVLMTVES